MADRQFSQAWFTDRLARAEKKPADLFHFMAGRFGHDRAKTNKMRNGTRRPQPEELPALMEWLGLSLDDKPRQGRTAEIKTAPLDPPDVRIGAATDFPNLGPRDVPVRQIVTGGDKGDFIFTDEPIDFVRRPPALSGQRVIAAFVTGISMTPKYEPGEPVYAYVGRPALPGDYVIIELHPSSEEGERQGYIKRLVRRTAKVIICEQFTPAKQVEFPANRVMTIYKIVTTSELLGS